MLRRFLILFGGLLAVAGCTTGTTSSPPGTEARPSSTAPPASSASPVSPTPASATPLPAGATTVIPFFLRNGVVAAGQRVATTGDAHVDAVQTLARGPSEADKAAGLTDAVPSNTVVNKLTVNDGVATIDLSRTFETRDTQPQVAQVVYTLTQFPEITKVKFLIEGQDNGATGVPPIGRDDLPRYTPDVLLDAPGPGLSSPATVKVSGTIAASYDSFGYRIESAFGQELATGTVAAKFGTGRKRFDQTVEVPAGTTGGVNFVLQPPTGSTMAAFTVPFTITG